MFIFLCKSASALISLLTQIEDFDSQLLLAILRNCFKPLGGRRVQAMLHKWPAQINTANVSGQEAALVQNFLQGCGSFAYNLFA